ncbi:ABC-type amino acid transport substrate-binding protein [Sedimentibacter acidaminivorans]|uniref:ABC-type amino acid transport substrate-binding protein n=1 Tax=Sedimentibacter acidaminivorans TaxID=913099 RepID=A0ABS4GC95_9FIRM|nr:transporter substrate-binding domain-containing protein [Sedimentibacter acidaminivorans]MBP1925313.1 ABC-type amino acid transport substrate-binding protein [Sedimentibacter acidaminivorans]
MKKTILIISIASLMLIVIFLIFSSIKKEEPVNLQLTQDEKQFIDNNKDNIFFMGYYNTPSEEFIIRKLCSKLSQDTGLNIFPFKEIWDNNLKLLQSGQLAMVANMNVTDDRLKYAQFTSSFASHNIGIYSNYDNKINQYSDLIGKKIGIEKSVYIMDDFKIKYPEIQFDKIYYNNLDELKMALTKGEIDGFMSSKSYCENLNFFYFNINSLSMDNNHIGISKDYPVLYNIMKKEVNYLINIGWDNEVKDLLDFHIETKLINLTDREKNLIKDNGTITVGLPKDYSYYAYGDDYPNGIIPALFTKIEFLTGLDFIYYYDSYENLIVRDDVDIVVSSDSLPFSSTVPIFSNNLIAVSNGNWNSIKEIYELEPYIIGMVNDAVFINEIKSIMPYLDIRLYANYKDLYKALEKKNIDYAVLPNDLFGKKQSRSGLVNNGVINSKFHYIYCKDKDTLIGIINKCLLMINMDSIVNEEVSQLIDEEEKLSMNTISLIVLLILILYFFIKYIIKLKDNVNRLLYYDQETMFHNELWLRTKLKINYNNYIYFLVNPQNLTLIFERYGENAYKKAQKNMITTINEHMGNQEYVIKLLNNNYLLIKKTMEETSRIIFLNQLKYLFHKRFTIFDINYNYQMNVVSLKPEDDYYNFDKLIKELKIGLQYAKHTRDVVDYTFALKMCYMDLMFFVVAI